MELVWSETWANGAKIEVLFYPEPLPGEDESDRIHLLVTDCEGEARGWLMNIEDATGVIAGLARAVKMALSVEV